MCGMNLRIDHLSAIILSIYTGHVIINVLLLILNLLYVLIT